jgi:hypothetical protein
MSRASDLARGLGARAEAVCRHYLSNGRRQGRYWIVGDVHNTPGGSLYVRLTGDRAGQWTDAATSEHGDLLDLIALNRGLDFRATLDEARHFLGQRSAIWPGAASSCPTPRMPCGSTPAAIGVVPRAGKADRL